MHMRRNRRSSYAWAHHAQTLGATDALSSEGWEGLEYAEQLADAAAFRAERALAHEPLPPPRTVEDLALQYCVSASTIRRRIALAREQTFGVLSEAGIRYRVRALRRRLEREASVCNEPGCPNRIPRTAPAHRRYCDEHSVPAARTRRHRANAGARRSGERPRLPVLGPSSSALR